MKKLSFEERSAELLQEGRFEECMDIALEGLTERPDNYELFFAAGISSEERGRSGEAFYLYFMAMELAAEQNKKEDEAAVRESFDRLCNTGTVTEYGLGKAFEELLHAFLEKKAYTSADLIAAKFLFHSSPEIAKPVLTEQNMLYKMMLETVLCEERRYGREHLQNRNTMLSYENDPVLFQRAYQELTIMMRRIWFGFPIEKQKELTAVLDRYPISSDMLSVVAKYAVPEEYWRSLFESLVKILEGEKRKASLEIAQYLQWMKKRGIGGRKQVRSPRSDPAGHKQIRKLSYKKENREKAYTEKNGRKLAFLFLTNDELYARECEEYLQLLNVPEGWEAEILEIWDAPGMAAGYNFGMGETDAAIRIYLHQDTFLIEESLLKTLTETFDGMERPGMLGIFGSLTMDSRALWYKNAYEDSVLNLYQDAVLTFLYPKTEENGPVLLEGAMLDGVFLAENAELPWREDLFDGWHFYDISRSMEMREAGYRTAFLVDKTPWALHETTMRRDSEDRYEYYRKVFLKKYIIGG